MQNDLFENKNYQTNHQPQGFGNGFLNRYRISLRLDHFLLGLIGLVISFSFVYSQGVDRGKHAAEAEWKRSHSAIVTAEQDLSSETVFASKPTPPVGSAPAVAVVPAETVTVQPAKTDEQVHVDVLSAANTGEDKKEPVLSGYPQGKYTIQSVTYLSEEEAKKAIEKLKGKGLEGFVIRSGKYVVVCVDAFNDMSQAKETLKQLKVQGIVPPDAYVRNIPAVMGN